MVGTSTSVTSSVSPHKLLSEMPFGCHRVLEDLTQSRRFTDSPIHDPYAATNGLLYSHCGWIFRKPTYPRMKLIERADLEADPGERICHLAATCTSLEFQG